MTKITEFAHTAARVMRHERFYSAKQICDLLGIHIATLYDWRRKGLFPQPHRLGPRTVRWTGNQILTHLNQPKAGSMRDEPPF